MNMLQLIPEASDCDGFQQKGIIAVNIEKLWKEAKRRAKVNPEIFFIKNFSNTYTHEFLHSEIENILGEHSYEYMYGEEKLIYSMLEDKWYKCVDKYYRKEYNYEE